jgi:hypothetical protein
MKIDIEQIGLVGGALASRHDVTVPELLGKGPARHGRHHCTVLHRRSFGKLPIAMATNARSLVLIGLLAIAHAGARAS